MIDSLAMIFSLGMVIFLVLRAHRLDRHAPWFAPGQPPADQARPPQEH